MRIPDLPEKFILLIFIQNLAQRNSILNASNEGSNFSRTLFGTIFQFRSYKKS